MEPVEQIIAISILDILKIVIPILGFLGWVYLRIDKKLEKLDAKCEARFDKIDMKLDAHDKKFDVTIDRINSLDSRVSKFEGKLEGKEYQDWKQRMMG